MLKGKCLFRDIAADNCIKYSSLGQLVWTSNNIRHCCTFDTYIWAFCVHLLEMFY